MFSMLNMTGEAGSGHQIRKALNEGVWTTECNVESSDV